MHYLAHLFVDLVIKLMSALTSNFVKLWKAMHGERDGSIVRPLAVLLVFFAIAFVTTIGLFRSFLPGGLFDRLIQIAWRGPGSGEPPPPPPPPPPPFLPSACQFSGLARPDTAAVQACAETRDARASEAVCLQYLQALSLTVGTGQRCEPIVARRLGLGDVRMIAAAFEPHDVVAAFRWLDQSRDETVRIARDAFVIRACGSDPRAVDKIREAGLDPGRTSCKFS